MPGYQCRSVEKKSYLNRLQEKWGLKSIFQTIMVLIVFAFTGSTVLFIKPLIFDLIGFDHVKGVSGVLLYIILVFPLYQILILIYGFIFGQFAFFLELGEEVPPSYYGQVKADEKRPGTVGRNLFWTGRI